MLAQQLGQHVGEAEHCVHRRAIWPRHRRQRVIGAEDEARSVDQDQMEWRLGSGSDLGVSAKCQRLRTGLAPVVLGGATFCRGTAIAAVAGRRTDDSDRQPGFNCWDLDVASLPGIIRELDDPQARHCGKPPSIGDEHCASGLAGRTQLQCIRRRTPVRARSCGRCHQFKPSGVGSLKHRLDRRQPGRCRLDEVNENRGVQSAWTGAQVINLMPPPLLPSGGTMKSMPADVPGAFLQHIEA